MVVVPARNEAERILPCLEALRCQWSAQHGNLHRAFATVLVINGSNDATEYEALQWATAHPELAVTIVDVDFPEAMAHVGSARHLGFAYACALFAGSSVPRTRQLLFSTDSDSRLAHDAVARGLDELERADAFGAHIIAGEPDPSRIGKVINRYATLLARVRFDNYAQAFERHPPHGVFGGAGFGVSRAAYEAVGGVPRLAFDEDQHMRRRLLDAGYRVNHPRDVIVYTSTRTEGRTPWGMARQLAVWDEDYAHGRWPIVPGAAGLLFKYELKAALRRSYEGDGSEAPHADVLPAFARPAWALARARASYELAWRALWTDADFAHWREARYAQVPLPQAVRELEVHYPSAGLVAIRPLRRTASGVNTAETRRGGSARVDDPLGAARAHRPLAG